MLAYSYGLSYVSLASQIALTTQRLTFDFRHYCTYKSSLIPMTPSKMIIYFQLRQVTHYDRLHACIDSIVDLCSGGDNRTWNLEHFRPAQLTRHSAAGCSLMISVHDIIIDACYSTTIFITTITRRSLHESGLSFNPERHFKFDPCLH